MASAFELFGELKVNTQAFQGSLKDADAQLRNTQQELNKTEEAAEGLQDKLGKAVDLDASPLTNKLKDAKTATEGTAEATEKAAAASAAMTGSLESNVAAVIALHTGLISIGAILAAGVVTILAAKKLSEDIRKEAEARLVAEEAIVAVLNKQALAAKEFRDARQEAAEDRGFDRFLDSSSGGRLRSERDSLQKEYDAAARELQVRLSERADRASKIGFRGDALTKFLAGAQETAEERQIRERRQSQLNALDAGIEGKDFKQRNTESPSGKLEEEIKFDKLRAYHKQLQENYKIEQQLAQRQDAFNLEHVNTLTQLKKFHFKSVAQNAVEAFDQEVAIARKREELVKKAIDDAKKWADAVKKATKDVADAQKQVLADYSQTLNNRVQAVDLRDEARQFTQGRFDTDKEQAANFQKNIQDKLNAVGAGYQWNPRAWSTLNEKTGQFEWDKPDTARYAQEAIEQVLRDQAIIDITKGIDPAKLTYNQRQLAAGARLREAGRLDKEKTEGVEALKEAVAQLKILNASGGLSVRITNEAPDKAKTETKPRKATTQNYYTLNTTPF